MAKPGPVKTVAVVALLAGWGLAWAGLIALNDTALPPGFNADAPETRKQTAWDSLPTPNEVTRRQLMAGDPDPDVRAAYAYTLGRSVLAERARNEVVAMLADQLATEEHPLVRAELWLALARQDPTTCVEQLGEADAQSDGERLAQAQAAITCGSMQDVDLVLRLAADGNHDQRMLGARLLTRELVPLIRMVGRWPVDRGVPPAGEPWDAQQVSDLRALAEGLDWQQLRDHAGRDEALVAAARHNLAKVSSARNWLVRLLFE